MHAITTTKPSDTRGREVTIRPARPGDERAISALFEALHADNAALEPRFALADGWEAILAADLARDDMSRHGIVLLAWAGAAPVGLAMLAGHTDSPLFRHRRWAELLALYVAPEACGGDVAARLMVAGMTWARARGHGEVRLYVTAANERARRFYAKSGLRPIQEIWTADLDPHAGAGVPDDLAREAA